VVADPWARLGIAPTASYAEAHRAYVLRSQLLHPDRHQGAPTDVLAEADRAMRELNEAWDQVRAFLARPEDLAPPGQSRTPVDDRPGGDPPPAAGNPEATAATCLDWVVDRLIEAGREHGDPLAWEEILRLRLPIAGAPGGRRFERWVARRRQTMRQAVADDASRGQGTDRWAQAWRVLGESPATPVVMLLLDRR
jgi:hypothetical protein